MLQELESPVRISMLGLADGPPFSRTAPSSAAVGRPGFAFGEAVFTTAMTGYQEVVTDPSFAEQIVCFTAAMVGNYGVDADRCESRRPHARAVVMREARGPAWTDWLHERGLVALSGIDTRTLVAAPARLGRDAGDRRRRRGLRSRRRSRRSSAAGDGKAARSRPRSRRREPYVLLGRGYGADRGARLRLQALDPAPARLGGRGGHRLPARRRPGRARALRRRPALERARRPGAARGRGRRRSARCSAACRCSGSASATSCSRSRPGTRPSSSRSATAAPTTRCWSKRSTACSSRARTTASRSAARTREEVTHVSLYDGTVEGLDFPELRARSVQFHPEARPGPARRAGRCSSGWVQEVSLAEAA